MVIDIDDDHLDLQPIIDGDHTNIAAFNNMHTALQIGGDGGPNGDIRVQIRNELVPEQGLQYYIDVVDAGPNSVAKLPTQYVTDNRVRKVLTFDQKLYIDNTALIDTNGKGIIADVWGQDPIYRSGVRGCNSLVQGIAAQLNLDFSESLQTIFAHAKAYAASPQAINIVRKYIPLRHEFDDGHQYHFREYSIAKVDENGKVAVAQFEQLDDLLYSDTQSPELLSEQEIEAIRQEYGPQLVDVDQADGLSPTEIKNGQLPQLADVDFAGTVGKAPSYPYPDFGFADMGCLDKRRRSLCSDSSRTTVGDKLIASNDASEVAFSRVNGKFQAIASYTSSALDAAGAAALVAAAAFVVLDFIEGHFAAASFGLASLVLGAASLVVAGPIGILIAGLSALFSILPGIFEAKEAPKSNDNFTKIVQWSFFGDTTHTGNEKCDQARVAAKLAPNCTAVYGAGVIAKMFQWEIFDAVTFLIWANQGHAISIPDIANLLNITDHTNPGTNRGVFNLDCGVYHEPFNGNRYQPGSSQGALQAPKAGYPCGSPKYALDRTKVILPMLNVSAASVYNQVIPANQSDCKLISDPINGVSLAFWNITITGRPAAIACNLTGDNAGVILDPTASYSNTTGPSSNATVGLNGTQTTSLLNHTSNSTVYSNANTTTDGSPGRAYISPPYPAKAFAVLNSTNSACMTGRNQNLCLPNGTYTTQKGGWGFSTKLVTDLSMPFGSSLNFSIPYVPDNPPCPTCYDASFAGVQSEELFTNNISSSASPGDSKALANSISILSGSDLYQPIFIHTPPAVTIPCICLFSETSYSGEVTCIGMGGGNLTAPFMAKAKSLSVVGGATAWIYPQYYGDLGGTYVSTSVEDLSQLPYGTKGSFSQNIRALWIDKSI